MDRAVAARIAATQLMARQPEAGGCRNRFGGSSLADGQPANYAPASSGRGDRHASDFDGFGNGARARRHGQRLQSFDRARKWRDGGDRGSTGDWPGFVNDYIEASFKANPGFAVVQGRHEFDGQIADCRETAIQQEVDRLKKAIADAAGLRRRQARRPSSASSATIWSPMAKGQLFWIDPTGADQLHTNPASYLGFLDPSVYVTVPYAPKEQRLKSYIKFLQNVPRAVEQMRANIRTPMASSFVDYAKNAFGGFAEYYPGDGMSRWKGVGTPEDQQALKAASTMRSRR